MSYKDYIDRNAWEYECYKAIHEIYKMKDDMMDKTDGVKYHLNELSVMLAYAMLQAEKAEMKKEESDESGDI